MIMKQPIFNAGDRKLTQNPGTLPNMQSAVLDYFQPMMFTRIVKTVENFNVVEKPASYYFQGVRQPFTKQQLMMKPEGQRSWKWEMIHALPSLILNPDDIINFNNVTYRVMGKLDYAEYGYLQYEIVQDYKP